MEKIEMTGKRFGRWLIVGEHGRDKQGKFDKKTHSYYSQIHSRGKTYHLGCFKTIEEATEARKMGEVTYW